MSNKINARNKACFSKQTDQYYLQQGGVGKTVLAIEPANIFGQNGMNVLLGAGIARTTLDFALIADYTLVVTTPEDIQTGYGCAKAAAERLRELEDRYKKKGSLLS